MSRAFRPPTTLLRALEYGAVSRPFHRRPLTRTAMRYDFSVLLFFVVLAAGPVPISAPLETVDNYRRDYSVNCLRLSYEVLLFPPQSVSFLFFTL